MLIHSCELQKTYTLVADYPINKMPEVASIHGNVVFAYEIQKYSLVNSEGRDSGRLFLIRK